MNKRHLTLIMMLVAGLVAVVITFIMNYPILAKLGTVLAVLAVFFFIGTIIENVIGGFEKKNAAIEAEKKRLEEEAAAAAEAAEAEKSTENK